MRKIISCLLIMAMTLSIISGCGSTTSNSQSAESSTTSQKADNSSAKNEADGSATEKSSDEAAALSLPISKELINIDVFWPAPANVLKFIKDFNEGSVWPIIEKQTNIHVNWIHGNDEQFNLMINSGDLADIIVHDNPDTMKYPGGPDKAIDDGAYLRLNEYLDKYSLYYKKLIESTPDFYRDSRTDDGNIWGFAMLETNIQGPYTGLVLRQDWLDELGIDTPVTFDDWYAMLKKFKDEKNCAAPLILPRDLFSVGDNALMAGYDVGYDFFQVDKVVKYGPIEPGYKDYITMLAKWYKEGLIDKDFATRDDASRDQMIYTTQAGTWFDGFWMLDFRKRAAEDSDTFRSYAVATPVRKKGDVAHLRQNNYNVRNPFTAVSAKSKYPVECVRWLDNLYSDENYILTNWGVEGESHVKDDQGNYILTDLITKNPEGLVMAEALFQYTVHHGPMWRIWDREAIGWTEDEIDCEKIWYAADNAYVIPFISLTADEGTEFANIMSDIRTFVKETSIKYVIGTEDLSTFDNFVSQIKAMNIDGAIEIQQAALDRYYKR